MAAFIANFMATSCSGVDISDSTTQNVHQIAFTHANIIPMTADTLLRNYTELVDKGIIIAVGPSTDIKYLKVSNRRIYQVSICKSL